MNHFLGIIPIIQAADISAVSKTSHKVIIFEFPVKIDINYFIISLPQLFLRKWTNCDYVVESIMLSILSMSSRNIFNYEIEIKTSRMCLGWQEGCSRNSNLERVHTCLDSGLLDEGGHIILETDDFGCVLLTLKLRSPMQ